MWCSCVYPVDLFPVFDTLSLSTHICAWISQYRDLLSPCIFVVAVLSILSKLHCLDLYFSKELHDRLLYFSCVSISVFFFHMIIQCQQLHMSLVCFTESHDGLSTNKSHFWFQFLSLVAFHSFQQTRIYINSIPSDSMINILKLFFCVLRLQLSDSLLHLIRSIA